jgi:hypothetical protein
LYDTGETFGDAQLVVGAQEAQLGGTSKRAPPKRRSLQAVRQHGRRLQHRRSRRLHDGHRPSGRPDLPARNVRRDRQGGRRTRRSVAAYVARGYRRRIILEIEAGSMGKPNQAIEIKNWQRNAALLIQLGSIKPLWLARKRCAGLTIVWT